MTTAFHGDPALKADVLDRLRRHAAAGTLTFGETRWDGTSGTAMGVSAQSEDSADYAARFGYPLALAAVLDTVAACAAPDRAVRSVLAWVEAVEPGTDLSSVPWRIAEDLLVRLGADRWAEAHYLLLRDLHRQDQAAMPLPRAAWTHLRALSEEAAARRTDQAAAAMNACVTACWSLRTSRSVLVELIDLWRRAATRVPNPTFDDALRSRADAALNALWTETQPARDAGDTVHIPTLFRAREPYLAALFEADLARSNSLFRERSEAVPALVLRHIADAGHDRSDTRS